MKHSKIPCKCTSYKFPHRFDPKRCAVYDELARTDEDERLDDPRRGQAEAANRMEAIYRSGRGR